MGYFDAKGKELPRIMGLCFGRFRVQGVGFRVYGSGLGFCLRYQKNGLPGFV